MDDGYRSVGCTPDAPTPYSSSYITSEMKYLQDEMLKLEPESQWGGTYANKPGYHNTRNQNSPSNYSVVDKPPDGGGPGDKAAAVDWTFPEAQGGNYTRIAKYTKRLLDSAQDPDDPRLNGWREFYGQSDTDTYVEGWDIRYNCPATSDSSHLWHIHLSVDRDKTTSKQNMDALLSVLRGETVAEWEDDVSAKDVWSYDVDPSSASYTAGGTQWTMFQRTNYLANDFAPAVLEALNALTDRLTALEDQVRGERGGGSDDADVGR